MAHPRLDVFLFFLCWRISLLFEVLVSVATDLFLRDCLSFRLLPTRLSRFAACLTLLFFCFVESNGAKSWMNDRGNACALDKEAGCAVLL